MSGAAGTIVEYTEDGCFHVDDVSVGCGDDGLDHIIELLRRAARGTRITVISSVFIGPDGTSVIDAMPFASRREVWERLVADNDLHVQYAFRDSS